MDKTIDWWWKMNLLTVCVQACFCQIWSHILVIEFFKYLTFTQRHFSPLSYMFWSSVSLNPFNLIGTKINVRATYSCSELMMSFIIRISNKNQIYNVYANIQKLPHLLSPSNHCYQICIQFSSTTSQKIKNSWAAFGYKMHLNLHQNKYCCSKPGMVWVK